MARPTFDGEIQRVRITLSLREGEDDDLIAWFDRLPARGRARAVMTALRQGGAEVVVEELEEEDDEIAEALEAMLF